MPRLTKIDSDRLGDLVATLDIIEISRPHVLPHFIEELRTALSLDVALSYTIQANVNEFSLDVLHYTGFRIPNSELRYYLGSYVARSRSRIGFFNPLRPEPAQRNRIWTTSIYDFVVEGNVPSLRKLGIKEGQRTEVEYNAETIKQMYRSLGIERTHQVRALVCDGDTLLAWIGGLSSIPIEPRQMMMLNRLLPSLRRRLVLEQRLQQVSNGFAALQTAMEHIPRPAFLVLQSGRIEMTNIPGRSLRAQNPRVVAEAISAAIRMVADSDARTDILDFEATPVHGGEGLPRYYLVVQSSRTPILSALIIEAAHRHGLTARESEVLALIVRGVSNKAIANKLDCAERTIEVHVSRLLTKLDVTSRSAIASTVLFGGAGEE